MGDGQSEAQQTGGHHAETGQLAVRFPHGQTHDSIDGQKGHQENERGLQTEGHDRKKVYIESWSWISVNT